jgi:hypothetical protein
MPRFTDSLISSINALYLALFSFILVYAYVCSNHLEYNQAIATLNALDKLVALRQVGFSDNQNLTEAKFTDLPSYFRRAYRKAHAARQDGEDTWTYESLEERGFPNMNIEGVYIHRGVSMPLAVGAAGIEPATFPV